MQVEGLPLLRRWDRSHSGKLLDATLLDACWTGCWLRCSHSSTTLSHTWPRLLPLATTTKRQLCWDKCMSTPGRDLSPREQACLDACAKRYMETTQFVIRHFEVRRSFALPQFA